jgi:hypothetical protein
MTFLRIVFPLYPFCLSMIFFGKPVSTFPDHALAFRFDAFSLREPVPPLRWKALWVARFERISPTSVVMADYRSEIALRNVRDSASTEYGF